MTGPTAVGKSALALELTERFLGEIISVDSRQVYIGMDIATAKPTPTELSRVPHHLIDIVQPDQEFTLPQFQTLAYALIDQIAARERLPFLVGGTIMYINALAEGWQVPQVEPDLVLRESLEREAQERGAAALFAELTRLDPVAAARIAPTNVRRVIRALEVCRKGQLFSVAVGKTSPPYRFLKLGLTLERDALYTRADARIDQMLANGLVAEVERLLAAGYAPNLPSMTGLGYSQIGACLRGEMTLAQAVEQMKFATHRYIRHQYTWFRRDPEIQWLDATNPDMEAQAEKLVKEFVTT